MPAPHYLTPKPKPWKRYLEYAAVGLLALLFVGWALYSAMVG
jgi:hypothetical protein